MTQTHFTCTLTRADEPRLPVLRTSDDHRLPRGQRPGMPPATLWTPSTVSPAAALTGPTPRASTSGNAQPWSWRKSEASSANRRVTVAASSIITAGT